MKRPLQPSAPTAGPLFAVAAVTLIAATYGLARLGYGLFLPAFSASFKLTPAVGGLLSSGASVIYCVSAGLGFAYAPRRPRLMTILAGSTAALGSAGIAAATSTGFFAAAVLLAGMGAGFASPALVELVQRNTKPFRAARRQSVVNSGTGFGVVAAGLLALLLGSSWRLAWVLIAVIAVAGMVGVLLGDVSRGRGSAGGTGGTGGAGGTAGAGGNDDGGRHQRGESRQRGLGLGALKWPLAAAFIYGIGCAAVWVYGRTLLEDQGGMPVALSAGAWIALGVGGAAAVLTAPWLARHSIRLTWPVTVLATAAATGVMALAPGSTGISFATAALFGLAYTAATSVLIIWATATASSSAAGTSALFISLILGQAAGAALTGALIEVSGFGLAFAVSAAACGVSAAGAIVRTRNLGRSEDDGLRTARSEATS
ncbi:MFS transporter [Arthrobacter sp. zg-Y1110]|uniref:MFS transporter n=1 Tax=Arthrobacter sp. zg-Y1110 TaxID=2886932 RepID=UPI001D13A7F6|nr:MFS transporter [Arthrobacter sp. zg-Y1110]MCC3291793.1 MFS transporter [Arthrobacter sp. zg-Y1110]UWX85625.1 MFS transporter [Arthrobacter sp. zg-Y1110]